MMNRWMLGSIAAAAVLALGPQVRAASTQPMTVGNLTGTLLVHQNIPCSNHIDQSTSVTGGRLTLTPSDGIDVSGGKQFTLASGSVSFGGFSMSGSCDTVSRTTTFSAVDVQLSRAVTFTAAAAGGGLFNFVIPASDMVIYQASIVDGNLDSGYKVPIQDVTGSIDLTNGLVSMHVVLGTSVHFQGGCVPVFGCAVDETDGGTVTADLAGTIAFADSDGDGVPDRIDNCRFVPNPTQAAVPTPVVTAPPDVTVASCLDHHIGIASANDVCDGGPVSLSNNAPAVFPLGGTTVVWTGQDQKSRVATASQIVTVVDTTAPTFTFVPGPISRNTCGPVNLGQATAADDCGAVGVGNDAPASFGVGTTTVTWTAKDASNNTATATQTVTVVDTVPPTLSCVSDGPPGGTYLVTSADACGAPTIRLGNYVIADGERIKINETGQSGVRLIGDSDGVRHFHVGKGQAVVTSTDGSGNVTTVACR
ncbi:MAG TPA: thrombospondin type 3 repeat-containing protein [Vicinamibacterales bacterium]|nr:thrombospondin type 3 repeat-containing protein [Vicinamibacterales bacterium]